MTTETDRVELRQLLGGRLAKPFDYLGPHRIDSSADRWRIRAFVPGATRLRLRLIPTPPDAVRTFDQLHPEGLFETQFNSAGPPHYHLLSEFADGRCCETADPYAFRKLLSDYDLHLLGEGRHDRSYRKLGAHLESIGGIQGVRFALWAPNAESVCLTGEFNSWSRRRHPMHKHEGTGIWQLFLPQVLEGDRYKYLVRSADGEVEKTDPYGFFFEQPPKTAAVVFDPGRYQWNDQDWMEQRKSARPLDQPVAIYEVHLPSWKRVGEENRSLSYRELATELVAHVRHLRFTHIELLPLTEYPYSGSWGYQTTGYFAPTSRLGDPNDFRFLVDECHRNGIGVLLDWVPAHFPRDSHALARFDGTHLYEHADPREGYHPDWQTLIFDYGRNQVCNFLISSALMWLDEYHLDGLRLDAVSSMLYRDYSRQDGEWLPNRFGGRENLEAIDFLRRFNKVIHELHPGVMTVAEESTAWPNVSRPTHLGGLGFTMKWNMGWMHDSLAYMAQDPLNRKFHHQKLTFSLLYAFSENYVLPLSHDEVVHGKGSLLSKLPGDKWQKFAGLRLYLAYLYGHPGKKLLFMGAELGQWAEWDAENSLDWGLLDDDLHRDLSAYLRELNTLYRRESACWEIDHASQGFEWIDFEDRDQSIISFLRRGRGPDNWLVFVFNFTPVPRSGYRIGVPRRGCYRELLNSDSEIWGGSNQGNLGAVESEELEAHGQPFSLSLTLPPLGALIFKAEPSL